MGLTPEQMQELDEARCQACKDMGVECPQGLTVWKLMVCNVCCRHFSFVSMGCSSHPDECQDCGGSLDFVEE